MVFVNTPEVQRDIMKWAVLCSRSEVVPRLWEICRAFVFWFQNCGKCPAVGLRSQVETIVQIFAHVGLEAYASFKVRKTELFLTCPTPRLTFFGKCPTVGKEKCKNARQVSEVGGWARLELIKPLSTQLFQPVLITMWVAIALIKPCLTCL